MCRATVEARKRSVKGSDARAAQGMEIAESDAGFSINPFVAGWRISTMLVPNLPSTGISARCPNSPFAFSPMRSGEVSLLDQFVGEHEQRGRDCNPERPGGLEADDEFEHGPLHDRQVSGLGAVEDFARIDADLTKTGGEIDGLELRSEQVQAEPTPGKRVEGFEQPEKQLASPQQQSEVTLQPETPVPQTQPVPANARAQDAKYLDWSGAWARFVVPRRSLPPRARCSAGGLLH